jgi:hypothetical protein
VAHDDGTMEYSDKFQQFRKKPKVVRHNRSHDVDEEMKEARHMCNDAMNDGRIHLPFHV